MALDLRSVMALAGYELSPADRERVEAYLEPYFREIQALRELDLPDDVEPVTSFSLQRWD